jgi:uncharacterized membrane protein YfcA
MPVANEGLGLVLALPVGIVLGLLGGGGSILALPIFLYVFGFPAKPAIAMSLAAVSASAFVAFVGHWRQRNVDLRVGIPFGLCAMASAFVAARLARFVSDSVQLGLFAAFAFVSAFMMLRRPAPAAAAPGGPATPRFTALLGLEAAGVGALTALIGAGGGFVIVPALVYLAHTPVRQAVGSSLFVITLNALSAFAGYLGQVPIDWPLVGAFTAVTAVGAVVGTRLNRHVPEARIRQWFGLLIIVLGTYLILKRLFLQ